MLVRDPMNRGEMGGCIYLIEAVGYGFYKIGRAEEITARFRGPVEAYQPIELRLVHVIDKNCGMFPLEYSLHHWFKRRSVRWLDKKHRTDRERFALRIRMLRGTENSMMSTAKR
jgi:hypothetical protein